jgi:hypothetical protein
MIQPGNLTDLAKAHRRIDFDLDESGLSASDRFHVLMAALAHEIVCMPPSKRAPMTAYIATIFPSVVDKCEAGWKAALAANARAGL